MFNLFFKIDVLNINYLALNPEAGVPALHGGILVAEASHREAAVILHNICYKLLACWGLSREQILKQWWWCRKWFQEDFTSRTADA